MTGQKPYDKLAMIWDKMRADKHSVKMAEYSWQIFHRFKIRPTRGLDLCCGTGTALAIFSKLGMDMSGLDQSASMLAVAARKLKNRKIKLYQKSLPHFRILEADRPPRTKRFDLITCFYDSLNYMKSTRQLQTAFRSVYRHLDPGGWFIFDMNTPAALQTVWGGQVYADAWDDIAWVWKNKYIEKTQSAELHTTCFVRKGRTWRRFDELHVERAYDNRKVIELLEGIGFEVKGFYRCFTFRKPARKTSRICAVAKRPNSKATRETAVPRERRSPPPR